MKSPNRFAVLEVEHDIAEVNFEAIEQLPEESSQETTNSEKELKKKQPPKRGRPRKNK